jgi:hypothetical protein
MDTTLEVSVTQSFAVELNGTFINPLPADEQLNESVDLAQRQRHRQRRADAAAADVAHDAGQQVGRPLHNGHTNGLNGAAVVGGHGDGGANNDQGWHDVTIDLANSTVDLTETLDDSVVVSD